MVESGSRLEVLRQGSPRIALDAAPAPVRAWLDRSLGSPVVSATTQTGGFSPGAAARVICADGTRGFVKAVGTELNPHSPELVRQEIRVLEHLPASHLRPTVLGSYDEDGWVALLLEDIPGSMPDLPWRADQLDWVMDALLELSELLTPAPTATVPRAVDDLSRIFTGWEDLVHARDGLDAWTLRHLDDLVEQGERAVAGLAGGDTLCHVDVRSDNILLTPERVVFVDWNWASLGPAWFDAALLLLEVRAAGGPDPDEVAATYPLLRTVAPEVITALVAAATGMFVRNCRLPPPPGLPTLRAFQAVYADALLDWTKERTGW